MHQDLCEHRFLILISISVWCLIRVIKVIYTGSSLGFIVALWETCCLSCYSLDPLAECVVARAEGMKTDARRVTVRALSRDGIVQCAVFLHCVQ